MFCAYCGAKLLVPDLEEPAPAPEPEPTPIYEVPASAAEPEPIPEPAPAPVYEEPAVAEEPEPIPAPEPEPEPAQTPAPEGEVYFDNIDQHVDINDSMFDMYNSMGEGTVFLMGQNRAHTDEIAEKNGFINLSDSEMQKGVVRIVDFGTGDRFEIVIPAGVREGDSLLITDTGLRDQRTGALCNIRVRIVRY